MAGGAIGVLLKLLFSFEPLEALSNQFSDALSWFPMIGQWLAAHPAIAGWIAGPVALAVLALAAMRNRGFAGFVDRLAPDPPAFTMSDLTAAHMRDRLISLEGAPLPFVGRSDSMSELDSLLTSQEAGFKWRSLVGVSGIGKSRLAIEWLGRARENGWDVGIIDPADVGLLSGWRSRRPTALVVEEARREWHGQLWKMLAALATASAKHPVRVLVTDQIAPVIDLVRGTDRDAVQAAQSDSPLRLGRLKDEDLNVLRCCVPATSVDGATLIKESAGRPRAALIMLNAVNRGSHTAALVTWVERFVPGLLGGDEIPPSLACPLLLCALAGAVDTDTARQICGTVDACGLTRFFDDITAERLEIRLPPLVPDDLAGELILQLLPRIDLRLREAIVDAALDVAPAPVEARLCSMWSSDRFAGEGMLGQPFRTLLWLQDRFDLACPNRVAAYGSRFKVLADRLAGSDAPRLMQLSVELAELSAARPFDPKLRHMEAEALEAAMTQAGKAGDLMTLEHLGGRLTGILEMEKFSSDTRVREAVAKAAANAAFTYRVVEDLEAVDRWADRLLALSSEDNHSNLEVKCALAFAAMSASAAHGQAGDFDGLERWGDVIGRLDRDLGPARLPYLLRCEAAAATNATHLYGVSRRFEDLERWRGRIKGLFLEFGVAQCPEMTLSMVMTEINRMTSYGGAGRFDELEDSARTVLAICDRFEFRLKAPFLKHRIKAIGAAIGRYGDAERCADVDRWVVKLCEFVPAYTRNSVIAVGLEMLVALFNAITTYAQAGNLPRLLAIEARVLELLADPRMENNSHARIMETYVATNIVNGLAATNSLVDLERWTQRVMDVVLDKRFSADPRIWANAANVVRNTMVAFYDAADYEAFGRWRHQLARIALTASADGFVQEIANGFGVSAAEQRIARHPFGDPFPNGPIGLRPSTDAGLDMRAAMAGVIDLH